MSFQSYDQRRHKEREKVELSDLDAYRQAVSSYLAGVSCFLDAVVYRMTKFMI